MSEAGDGAAGAHPLRAVSRQRARCVMQRLRLPVDDRIRDRAVSTLRCPCLSAREPAENLRKPPYATEALRQKQALPSQQGVVPG